MKNDLTVAQEIMNQVGQKALVMMGACNLGGDAKGLQFRIRGCKAYNSIRIDVNSMDTYDITFYKVAKYDVKDQHEVKGIYADMLHKTIEQNTGLYLSL